jgi:metallo-beta-lactamase family protein
MPPRITFHGAAQTVTGSRHFIEYDGAKILIDCGMFQGPREIRDLNWEEFPVDVADIDVIVITHAHTDHIGYLPRLWANGYRGAILATPGTIELAKISLPDGGRIQEEDARYKNRKGLTSHDPALPLFTEADAYEVLKLFRPVHFYQWFDLPKGAKFRYLPAGHILGSAFVEIYFASGERILMGGDLGRYDVPVMQDPFACDFAEYLVLESTYGNRLHAHEDTQSILADLIQQAVDRRSVILVPSFAIGRTQEMLWHINKLYEDGRCPRIPIYVDSPMANSATLLYMKMTEDLDKDMKIDLAAEHSPLGPDLVHFVQDRGMSKQLNFAKGPFMVIAGSGMATGGRILHHLLHRLSDPDNVVLFTGYQGEGTMGRRMMEGAEEVRIFRETVPVRATVTKLNSLSAHADANEIMRWLGNFKAPPKKTFIVHGEPPAQEALRDRIVKELGWTVEIPAMHQSFDLA